MDAEDRHTDGPTDRQTCTEKEKEVKDRKKEREREDKPTKPDADITHRHLYCIDS